MKFLKVAFSFVKKLATAMGYEISVNKRAKNMYEKTGLNLNISAGDYIIPGFKSLDIYTPHYYKSKKQFLAERIEYDLLKDNLPFSDSSVDNIYISHAIEHVDNLAVQKFIEESYRVLKKGGVLRLTCPDSKFLYSVSEFENEFWNWRIPSLSNRDIYNTNWKCCNQYDFLIRELATPRMRFYNKRIQEEVIYQDQVESLDYFSFTERLKRGLKFRIESPGDHINNWDFSRIKNLGDKAGFEHAIESKFGGSVSATMQGQHFDRTHPQMSLYVELIK